MSSLLQTATVLIKNCPDAMVDTVVSAIETFGNQRSLLAGPLNVTIDHCSGFSHTSTLSQKAIYMKTANDTSAARTLKAFVEDDLNATYKTDMFCIDVKQRNYPVLFTLLFLHENRTADREDLQAMFAPFGKCHVRVKDHRMSYINFPRFEQVVSVLKALKSAKLYLRNTVVLTTADLIPVQNAKFMLLFEALLVERCESIVSCKCITKHNLTTWFATVKKNENCEKTWEQLVDFVSEPIVRKFGWTYNPEFEVFRDKDESQNIQVQVAEEHDMVTLKPEPSHIAEGGMLLDLASIVDDSKCLESICNVNLADEERVDDKNGEEGVELLDSDSASVSAWKNTVQTRYVVDKTNFIPLYGDDELHPMHTMLCDLEWQLFGKCEASSTNIHYRLLNMETMLNIYGQTQPTPVRLVEISYWTQQYTLAVAAKTTCHVNAEAT